MAEIHVSTIEVFPTEMLKKILDKLDFKSLCFAKQTCKRWNEIIEKFELSNQASSKFLSSYFLLSEVMFLYLI